MKWRLKYGLVAAMMAASLSLGVAAETITIATVNNGDMIRMQELTADFSKDNPDIELNWLTLEENDLRQRVITDIATQGGQFDVVTIGTYEAPIWAGRGWLAPLNDMPADYDIDDILPSIRAGLSYEGILYAAPFYGESSFTMYRTDLFAAAGIKMPAKPSWDFIRGAALMLADKNSDIYGICLRGKPGWGENMAFLTAMANSYGARWFDTKWNAQFDSSAWNAAITDYVQLLKQVGPPNAAANGFNENLALFQAGKCAIWIDSTAAAQFVTNTDSAVADSVGFALAPDKGLGKRASWLWAWALAVPADSDKMDAAKKFVAWATSKKYLQLVASEDGWANVPSGTRTSLYQNPAYQKVAFAKLTLESITAADPARPTVGEVPYVGIQYVAIPEFPSIATAVGHQFAKVLTGKISIDEALENAQWVTEKVMQRARFIEE